MNVDELQRLDTKKSEVNAPPSGLAMVIEPERWVEKYGDVLFGFALVRVRDRAIAQDLVQDTFLAALKAKAQFAGRSTERAWLFGILRNKLVDFYRAQSREAPHPEPEAAFPQEQGAFCESGLGKDGWVKAVAPQAWDTPDEHLVSKEFQEVLQGCLSGLPDRVAQVFLLREVDGVSSQEICKDLDVSPNNLWVMLHRARMGLRRCLEVNWFANRREH